MSDTSSPRVELVRDEGDRRIWRDVRTGRELVELAGGRREASGAEAPAPLGLGDRLIDGVYNWVWAAKYDLRTDDRGRVVLTLDSGDRELEITVATDEDLRALLMGYRWPCRAPRERWPAVAEAVQRLMVEWTRHPLMFDHDTGEVIGMFLMDLADLPLSPLFLESALTQLHGMEEGVYAALLAVGHLGLPPDDVVGVAQRVHAARIATRKSEDEQP